MSLVNIDSLLKQVLRLVKKIDPPAGIELLSYKRNRSVSVAFFSSQEVKIRERGYVEQDLIIHSDELARTLKTLIKREFPRSRKVRIHKFADPEELDRHRNTL